MEQRRYGYHGHDLSPRHGQYDHRPGHQDWSQQTRYDNHDGHQQHQEWTHYSRNDQYTDHHYNSPRYNGHANRYRSEQDWPFDQRRPYGPMARYTHRVWEPPVGLGVFLFIKFPGHEAEFAAQAVVLGKRAVMPRGKFVGIARKIHSLSSNPQGSEALVVYLFESTEAARRFFVCDTRFKQPDFPPPAGACEAWTVVKLLPTTDDEYFKTYMMCENQLRGASYNMYKQEFARPFADLILQYGGQPFVVQSVGCESLRRHHVDNNTIETVHLFRNEDDLKRMMNDPKFSELKRRQLSMATDFTTVFTIDPEACP